MSKPDYKTHDPVGWCGDARRGAAMGRGSWYERDAETFEGRIYLRRVRLTDLGDYDICGTYWGAGQPLYWAANHDTDEHIDFVIRADDRADAKRQVLDHYPGARFWR